MLKNRTIYQGDVIEKLRELPNECVDVEITSPPYWGLRDYGVSGQWGLEQDFHNYLDKMRLFMDEMKRVLKKTGTCWINLGDTYSGGNAHSDWSGSDKNFDQKRQAGGKFNSIKKTQIQAKSRYGIPERFYANCIDDGWIARNHIPWVKENSMPSSVKDRFTNKWESVFFFAKEQKYYFNLNAVRVKPKGGYKPFNRRVRDAKILKQLGLDGAIIMAKSNDREMARTDKYGAPWKAKTNTYKEYQKVFGETRGNTGLERKQDNTLGANGKPKANYTGFNNRWKKHYDSNGNCLGCGRPWRQHTVSERAKGSMSEVIKRTESICWCNSRGKNPGDVFEINPKPFPEAHFATFPIDLPLKILKCACPPGGFVLDPFFGAGTVGLAAEKLGLNWIGIELHEKYIEIAKKRLSKYESEKLL